MTAVAHHQRAAKLRRRVKWWAAKLKVRPKQVRIQKMTRKWASCSTAGWISFSESLLIQPEKFQKYVIVHELLHLQVPNHGKLFKSLLSCYVGPMARFCISGRGCTAFMYLRPFK